MYVAYFLDVISGSDNFINPASKVSEIILEATEESFLFIPKRSLTDWLFNSFLSSKPVLQRVTDCKECRLEKCLVKSLD